MDVFVLSVGQRFFSGTIRLHDVDYFLMPIIRDKGNLLPVR